jgi:ribosomal protein S12 methylthiotransferase
MGCLSQRYRDELPIEIPEVDKWFGKFDYLGIIDEVRGERLELKGKGYERTLTTPNHYAYLKIAEGCDNRCTYCAIPLIRGSFRSRTIEDIVKEAKDLEELGVKELNLIAQDTTRYGLDIYGEYKLAELVRAICRETEIPWIRLLYCYPDKITDELVQEFKTNSKLVKYIDLPVQHINSRILKKMNRRGDESLVRSVIEKLRTVEGIAIRSTAIVGFPTESEEEFLQLCEFVKEVKFDSFGAFPYSREEGTVAYGFEGQIDEQVKQDRYDIIMREQLYVTEQNQQKHIGQVEVVLCEGFDPVSESYFGRTEKNAPDIDGKVFFF